MTRYWLFAAVTLTMLIQLHNCLEVLHPAASGGQGADRNKGKYADHFDMLDFPSAWPNFRKTEGRKTGTFS